MLGTEDKPGSSSAAELAAEDAEQVQEEEEEVDGPEDVDAEALELMGQGKRNLVVGDPPAAVQCFQEACELLAGKYGETAEECADAYFQYGCSLLELGSLENGVLGNALQGVPDESADSADSDEEGEGEKLDEKQKEEVSKQVKDALEANLESEDSEKEEKEKEDEKKEGTEEEKMEEDGDNKESEKADKDKKQDEVKEEEKEVKEVKEKNEESKEKKNEESKEKKNEEVKGENKSEKMEGDTEAKKEKSKDEKVDEIGKEENKEDIEKEDKDDAAKKSSKKDKDDKMGKKDGEGEAGPSTDDDQKEDADDVSNFQLAWEMLELARVIISKKEDEESKLRVSQIHLKLGELGLETEQYAQSVESFKMCLEIQEKYLDPESRLIAGTHYNLGLALSFDNKFEDSVKHYRESKQLIEKRLESLEKIVSEMEGKGKEKADENDPIVSAQKEMDELKELLPDIVSKLEDAKEMKIQARTSDGAGPSSSSGFASSSSGFASSGFAQSSSTAPVQQIAVRKADAAPATDISNLVRKKRKPEDTEEESTAESKRSRQEDEKATAGDDKPAVNGAGDSAVVNGNGQMANGNGVMNGDMNGDSKHSPEKPSEIKTKKLPAVEEEKPAAMETA